MNTVALIGIGMVGNALLQSFRDHGQVLTYDPKIGLRWYNRCTAWDPQPDDPFDPTDPYEYITNCCRVVFICVPTPMKLSGEQDLTILNEVVGKLAAKQQTSLTVVIKSTVAPGTTDRLANQFASIHFIFNPEFLREATAVQDFRHQARVVLGSRWSTSPVQRIYQESHPEAQVYVTDPLTAELMKYAANCFLAVKVSFANEFAQVCAASGVDYEELRRLLVTDTRIGPSHLLVPGPDGKRGFGMTCFPKDLNAMIRYARERGVAPTMLEAAWHKNLEVRPERDWEELKGRAVSGD